MGHQHVVLHIHTQKAVCSKLNKFPQDSNRHGKAQCKYGSTKEMILPLGKQFKDVGTYNGKHHAAANMQQFIPPADGIVEIPALSHHWPNGIHECKYVYW